ncbi:MAG: hypothetical protein JXB17_12815 [Bacteroidales bacterium]|nr:hypothetical protein [Bacteroidales bacterium]
MNKNIQAYIVIMVILLIFFLFGFFSGIIIGRKYFFEQGKKYMFERMVTDGE